MVFLNIPMDAETPSMRLLRPQALVQVDPSSTHKHASKLVQNRCMQGLPDKLSLAIIS